MTPFKWIRIGPLIFTRVAWCRYGAPARRALELLGLRCTYLGGEVCDVTRQGLVAEDFRTHVGVLSEYFENDCSG